MSPVEAVTVPRIHCEGKGIQAEATIQGAVIAELRAMGHKVVHSPHSFEPIMSRAHVISTLGGKMRGGADPRGGASVCYARWREDVSGPPSRSATNDTLSHRPRP